MNKYNHIRNQFFIERPLSLTALIIEITVEIIIITLTFFGVAIAIYKHNILSPLLLLLSPLLHSFQ
jgi:hypothetical protein